MNTNKKILYAELADWPVYKKNNLKPYLATD